MPLSPNSLEGSRLTRWQGLSPGASGRASGSRKLLVFGLPASYLVGRGSRTAGISSQRPWIVPMNHGQGRRACPAASGPALASFKDALRDVTMNLFDRPTFPVMARQGSRLGASINIARQPLRRILGAAKADRSFGSLAPPSSPARPSSREPPACPEGSRWLPSYPAAAGRRPTRGAPKGYLTSG